VCGKRRGETRGPAVRWRDVEGSKSGFLEPTYHRLNHSAFPTLIEDEEKNEWAEVENSRMNPEPPRYRASCKSMEVIFRLTLLPLRSHLQRTQKYGIGAGRMALSQTEGNAVVLSNFFGARSSRNRRRTLAKEKKRKETLGPGSMTNNFNVG